MSDTLVEIFVQYLSRKLGLDINWSQTTAPQLNALLASNPDFNYQGTLNASALDAHDIVCDGEILANQVVCQNNVVYDVYQFVPDSYNLSSLKFDNNPTAVVNWSTNPSVTALDLTNVNCINSLNFIENFKLTGSMAQSTMNLQSCKRVGEMLVVLIKRSADDDNTAIPSQSFTTPSTTDAGALVCDLVDNLSNVMQGDSIYLSYAGNASPAAGQPVSSASTVQYKLVGTATGNASMLSVVQPSDVTNVNWNKFRAANTTFSDRSNSQRGDVQMAVKVDSAASIDFNGPTSSPNSANLKTALLNSSQVRKNDTESSTVFVDYSKHYDGQPGVQVKINGGQVTFQQTNALSVLDVNQDLFVDSSAPTTAAGVVNNRALAADAADYLKNGTNNNVGGVSVQIHSESKSGMPYLDHLPTTTTDYVQPTLSGLYSLDSAGLSANLNSYAVLDTYFELTSTATDITRTIPTMNYSDKVTITALEQLSETQESKISDSLTFQANSAPSGKRSIANIETKCDALVGESKAPETEPEFNTRVGKWNPLLKPLSLPFGTDAEKTTTLALHNDLNLNYNLLCVGTQNRVSSLDSNKASSSAYISPANVTLTNGVPSIKDSTVDVPHTRFAFKSALSAAPSLQSDVFAIPASSENVVAHLETQAEAKTPMDFQSGWNFSNGSAAFSDTTLVCATHRSIDMIGFLSSTLRNTQSDETEYAKILSAAVCGETWDLTNPLIDVKSNIKSTNRAVGGIEIDDQLDNKYVVCYLEYNSAVPSKPNVWLNVYSNDELAVGLSRMSEGKTVDTGEVINSFVSSFADGEKFYKMYTSGGRNILRVPLRLNNYAAYIHLEYDLSSTSSVTRYNSLRVDFDATQLDNQIEIRAYVPTVEMNSGADVIQSYYEILPSSLKTGTFNTGPINIADADFARQRNLFLATNSLTSYRDANNNEKVSYTGLCFYRNRDILTSRTVSSLSFAEQFLAKSLSPASNSEFFYLGVNADVLMELNEGDIACALFKGTNTVTSKQCVLSVTESASSLSLTEGTWSSDLPLTISKVVNPSGPTNSVSIENLNDSRSSKMSLAITFTKLPPADNWIYVDVYGKDIIKVTMNQTSGSSSKYLSWNRHSASNFQVNMGDLYLQAPAAGTLPSLAVDDALDIAPAFYNTNDYFLKSPNNNDFAKISFAQKRGYAISLDSKTISASSLPDVVTLKVKKNSDNSELNSRTANARYNASIFTLQDQNSLATGGSVTCLFRNKLVNQSAKIFRYQTNRYNVYYLNDSSTSLNLGSVAADASRTSSQLYVSASQKITMPSAASDSWGNLLFDKIMTMRPYSSSNQYYKLFITADKLSLKGIKGTATTAASYEEYTSATASNWLYTFSNNDSSNNARKSYNLQSSDLVNNEILGKIHIKPCVLRLILNNNANHSLVDASNVAYQNQNYLLSAYNFSSSSYSLADLYNSSLNVAGNQFLLSANDQLTFAFAEDWIQIRDGNNNIMTYSGSNSVASVVLASQIGIRQLYVTADNSYAALLKDNLYFNFTSFAGLSATNGLTFTVLGGNYDMSLYEKNANGLYALVGSKTGINIEKSYVNGVVPMNVKAGNQLLGDGNPNTTEETDTGIVLNFARGSMLRSKEIHSGEGFVMKISCQPSLQVLQNVVPGVPADNSPVFTACPEKLVSNTLVAAILTDSANMYDDSINNVL